MNDDFWGRAIGCADTPCLARVTTRAYLARVTTRAYSPMRRWRIRLAFFGIILGYDMEFKQGNGWRCCYDPETGSYTAETGGGCNHNLYEITKEIYDHVDDPDVKWPTSLIAKGRHLYMTVNDKCGPPYTVILDSDYQKICPWAKTTTSGDIWPDELTDAAVEIFASEANNREQRRKKRENEKLQSKKSGDTK